MVEAKIVNAKARKLIGISEIMSLKHNSTTELWQSFGPHLSTIRHQKSKERISLQIYPKNYFKYFNPNLEFEKWAAVEVSEFPEPKAKLNSLSIPAGLYAVFQYQGLSGDPSIFEYIYGEWIAQSDYELDERPHFEILGPNYRNNDPLSEEEIWIPIK